jgi:hypothetical protein
VPKRRSTEVKSNVPLHFLRYCGTQVLRYCSPTLRIEQSPTRLCRVHDFQRRFRLRSPNHTANAQEHADFPRFPPSANAPRDIGSRSRGIANDSDGIKNDSRGIARRTHGIGNDADGMGNDSRGIGRRSHGTGNDGDGIGSGSQCRRCSAQEPAPDHHSPRDQRPRHPDAGKGCRPSPAPHPAGGIGRVKSTRGSRSRGITLVVMIGFPRLMTSTILFG